MRRLGSFFLAVTLVALGATSSLRSVSGAVATAASVVRELSPREQAVHVLNRLAFGPRPGDVERVMQLGVDKWIDQQLHADRIPDHESERMLAAYPAVGRTAEDLLREYPPAAQQLVRRQLRGDSTMSRQDSLELRELQQRNREFVGELVSSRVARAVVSERQLQEVMTDFWQNHFNVFIGKQQLRYYLADYDREAIRPNALGSFRELLGAVARSPAMLMYLDNAQSVADSGRPTLARQAGFRAGLRGRVVARRIERLPPQQREVIEQLQQRRPRGLNENYARELLELHTLGVDGGYTQQDVIEVARALTGWSINPPRLPRGGFVFRPEAHDAGEKVVLGHRLRAGRGIEDGEDVLDIVANHPSTARYIARKLAVRFVSDAPPPALVDRAAATFTRTHGDIRAMVKTIVTSNEFFSRAAYRSKVKSPFEVTVSALRAIGAQADTTPFSSQIVARLGQQIYGHQAPNGWPETGSSWMNTGSILNRINFGILVATGRIPGAPLAGWPQFVDLARAPRAQQVDAVVDAFLGGAASPDTREILMSGTNPMMAKAAGDSGSFRMDEPPRSMRGQAGAAGAAGQGGRQGGGRGAALFNRTPLLSGLPQVIGLALGSPEFQRR